MLRSRRCSRHCARPCASQPINTGISVLLVCVVVGGALFLLGTWMVRREAQAQTEVAREFAVPERAPEELELQLDQIERLAMVGQPWCIEKLEAEFLHDSDVRVRNAAEDALLVIRAR